MDGLALRNALTDTEALKTSMLLALNGNTPDHARWVNCVNFAREYSKIAHDYFQITNDPLPVYEKNKLPNPHNMIWPAQKAMFEEVYRSVLKLHGRIVNRSMQGQTPTGFDDLLHDGIRAASIAHYHSGDFRNAVLDGILAISDAIRAKTGLDADGDRLCNEAFSPHKPILIFSNLGSDSGRNDQVGFMEILKGVYKGIRNPKAHSLTHDLNQAKAAQYLIMLSLLMRRIDEATLNS